VKNAVIRGLSEGVLLGAVSGSSGYLPHGTRTAVNSAGDVGTRLCEISPSAQLSKLLVAKK